MEGDVRQGVMNSIAEVKRTVWEILDIDESDFKEIRKLAALASFNENGPGASRAQQTNNQVVVYYLWQAMKIYGCSASRQENARRLIEKHLRDRSDIDGVLTRDDLEDRNLIITHLKSYYSTLINEARKNTGGSLKAYFNNSYGTLVEGFLPSDTADLSIDGKQVWGRPIGAGKLKRDLYPALSTRKRDYISSISPGEVGEVHDVVKMMRESRDADVKSAANTFYFLSGESLWRASPPFL